MDLEQQLGAALAPCKPAATLRATVLERIAAAARPAAAVRRGGRRTILFGTVLAVAAAAAMLVVQWREGRPVVATSSSAQPASPARIEPVADAADTLRADSATSAAGERRTFAAPPQTFTVQVLPPQLSGDDPAMQSALNEFYATAVRELGAVPGLVLVAAGEAAGTADYRIRFNGGFDEAAAITAMFKESGQVQPMPAATRTWRMQLSVDSRRAPPVRTTHGSDEQSVIRNLSTLTLVDGQSVVSTNGHADAVDLIPSNLQQRMAEVTNGASATYGSGAMNGEVNLVLNRRLEGVRVDVDYGVNVNETGERVYRRASVEVVGNQANEYAQKMKAIEELNLRQADGYTLVYANAVMGSPPQDPAGLAATEIERLRMAVFPVDAELADKLRARLLDANQPHERRLAALQLLAGQQEGMENPDTIRGALVLLGAGPDAAARAAVWRLLRVNPQRMMLRPLLDMLGTARDATLRLEILTMLASDFKGDPAALATLKTIAANDPDALVRNVATRGLSGDAAWHEYAASTIGDARLTPAERFAPLAYLFQAEQGQDVRNLLDEPTLQALATVLPPLLEDAQNRARATMLLGELHVVQSPLAVDIALASLDRVTLYSTRSVLVNLLGQHRADPRAQQRLEAVAANDSDPKVRALATALLKMPVMPGR